MFITDLSDIEKSKLDIYMERLLDWLVDKALDILIALIFIFIGTKLVKFIVKIIKRSFDKAGLESSISGFLLSLIRGILYAVVFIMAAATMGFQVTSLVTILGTAGLAIGLALQGSLANFAGGVLILLMKPFRGGETISVGVAYDSDIKLVKSVLENVVTSCRYYDTDREISVFVDSFGESAINMGIRCYVNTEDYWQAKWERTEK